MSSTVDVTFSAKASPHILSNIYTGPPQGPVRSATHCGREHCGRLGAMQCDCYPAAKKEAEKEAEKQVAKLYVAVAAKAKKAEKQVAKASKAVIQKKPAKKDKIRHWLEMRALATRQVDAGKKDALEKFFEKFPRPSKMPRSS
jgi:hypothetical protein